MKLNERLTKAIEQSKYKQKEIAKKLHISEGNISNWKKGLNAPSVEMLYELCILLEESADYLLGLEDETGKKTYKEQENKNIYYKCNIKANNNNY